MGDIMLYSVDTCDYVRTIPHKKEYQVWKKQLPKSDFEAIETELTNRLNTSRIETSSWIPGADWTGTVFQPIFEKACKYDEEAAAQCFGLILWEILINHPAIWSFGRYKKGQTPIKGMTYFRVEKANF
jgi:hypothetical protein